MILYFKILLKKEFLLGLQTSESIVSVFFFTALISLVFHFGFSVEHAQQLPPIPSFIWLATLFGGMLRLTQTYESENEDGVMNGMKMVPKIAIPFFLSKFVYNLTIIILLEVFTFILLIILFNVRDPLMFVSRYWTPFFLGAVGFSCIGTVFSHMVISHNRKEMLLAMIAYPVLIPLISAVLKSFLYGADGSIIGLDGSWLKILAVFDVLYFILSLMVFEEVWKV